jgi:hypothetical protein
MAPRVVEYVPASQNWQVLEPLFGLNFPAPQMLQMGSDWHAAMSA